MGELSEQWLLQFGVLWFLNGRRKVSGTELDCWLLPGGGRVVVDLSLCVCVGGGGGGGGGTPNYTKLRMVTVYCEVFTRFNSLLNFSASSRNRFFFASKRASTCFSSSSSFFCV